MTVYGPHCSHDECSWLVCDVSGIVEHECREQATCEHCGPTSPDWPRLSAAWVRWCVETYGTSNSDALRSLDATPPNVLATAELVEAHPPRG